MGSTTVHQVNHINHKVKHEIEEKHPGRQLPFFTASSDV